MSFGGTRRFVRKLFRVGGAVCLVTVVLLLAMHSPPARRLVLDRLRTLLASRQIDIELDALRYNAFAMTLEATNLRVRSAASRSLPAFANVRRVRLDLSLPELLRGRYVVASGVAEGIDIHYVRASDGADNFPRIRANAAATKNTIDYLIARLSIPDLRIHLEDHARRSDLLLTDAAVEVTGQALTGRHRVQVENARGTFRVGEEREAIDYLSALLDVGREDVAVERVEADGAGARLVAAGAVQDFAFPQLRVEVKGTLDAARAARLLAIREPLKGEVGVDVIAQGRLSALTVDGRVTGSRLQFRTLAPAEIELRGAFDLAHRFAQVSSARLQASWGRVAGSGALALDPTRTSFVRADIQRLDFAAMSRAMDVSYAAISRVDATLDAAWPGLDFRELSGTASATLNPMLTRAELRMAPVEGRVSARAERGALAAEFDSVTLAGAQLSGRVQVARDRTLDGELRVAAHDVRGTAGAVETILGRAPGSLLPAPVGGSVSSDVRLGGTMDAPTAIVNLHAPSLSVGEASGVAAAAAVTVTPKVLTVVRGDVAWNSARAEVKGAVELTNYQRLDVTFGVPPVEVQALLPESSPLSGTVSATGAIRGSLSRPLANIALHGVNLAALGEQLGSLTADAVLNGRDVTLSRLVIDKPQPGGTGRITATGSYHLDSRSHTLDLQSENLQLVSMRAPGGRTISGPVQLSGKSTGTLTSPSATVNLVFDRLDITGRSPVSLGRIAIAATAVNREAAITATAERFNFDADAQLTLARPWPLTANIRTTNLDLERLPFDARGIASVTGTLRGTVASLAPDLVVTITDAALRPFRQAAGASNLQVNARIVDGAARIERLTGSWGTATIDASGTIPLDVLPSLPVEIPGAGGAATISATVRGLDPATVPGVPAGLTGNIDLDVKASAARADLSALEGAVTSPRLEIALNRLTLTQKEPSTVTIGGGVARVERLALSGSAGELVASGSIALAGQRVVDATLDGTLDVAALSGLSTALRTDGTAIVKLSARGPLAAPELGGTVNLSDATFANDDLDIAATGITARVALGEHRIELSSLAGEINGGMLAGSGSVTLGNGTVTDIDMQLSAKDIAYDAPLNLRSLSDATLRMTRRGEEFVLGGQVTIKEAGLTSDINFEDDLFASVGAPRTVDLTDKRDPFLERVRFEINVDTASPILIDNNLARAEIDADLRVAGTPYSPGLTGRLSLAEGAHVTLNARRYEVERGVITFVDERRIAPAVDLVLNTQASNYDVRISVAGTPGKTETSWTSEPPLSEPDIMALVVTGRTVDEMRGEESEVARVQALSYLTGRVGSKFGRGLERATGISEVRIEPVLIANETDPTARLTVGQDITDQMKLVYSTNLTDSNDQIWVAEYDVTRRFQLRAVREHEDDSYRGDFRHDLRFGGKPAPRRQAGQRPTIDGITVNVDGGLDETTIRRLFKLKTGDEYDFFAARSGIERVERRYLEVGYLQSRVRLERVVDNAQARLTVNVRSGPLVHLRFEGETPPSKVQEAIANAWHRGIFDKQREADSVRVLREWLIGDNYLQARIDGKVDDSQERRTVTFRIERGPRSDSITLAFEGAAAIAPSRLDRIVAEQKMERQLFTDPEPVTNLLQRYYRDQGYFAAEVDAPRYEFEGSRARVVVPVREGPRFHVRQVTTNGNTAFDSAEILAKLSLVGGAPFLSAAAEHSLTRIRDLYWPRGYNDMRSEYALVVDRSAAAVDVTFAIVEGKQSVVSEIAVNGNDKTSERLVRGQVELAPLQPLDLAVLARSRRNLYGTGAFSIADITREELGTEDGSNQRQVRLNVSVREVQPVQLRYGLSYDTEGGLGGILDFSVHNAIGKARVFGVQGRYDSEIHEARIYVGQPSLRSWPRKTTASVYFREDLEPPTEQTDPFDISRQGASIQQEMQFRKAYIWSYGYRYELATTAEPSLGAGVTETVRVTPLSGTLTRETRDEVLDASKGTFLSQAFAYSPSWLGSDRPYVKYYGQYFRYFPLRPEQTKPFTNEVLRARLVFATGVRVGLARGIGGEVPTSERFYAGGSTTLRGFEQNAVGPIGANNVPAGGNAVIVFNNELRTPVFRRLDGVLFLDVGNVYPNITDFTLSDLRESAGVGIRLRTRWVLLRGDYGWVLDPRPGERRSRFYFSIGQAF